jgi:transposase
MGQELLRGDYIQANETPVDVQMHDARGKNHQAYLWQYGRPAGPVVFDFRMGREREGPKRFLGHFEGILQSDGYGLTIMSAEPESCMPRVPDWLTF